MYEHIPKGRQINAVRAVKGFKLILALESGAQVASYDRCPSLNPTENGEARITAARSTKISSGSSSRGAGFDVTLNGPAWPELDRWASKSSFFGILGLGVTPGKQSTVMPLVLTTLSQIGCKVDATWAVACSFVAEF